MNEDTEPSHEGSSFSDLKSLVEEVVQQSASALANSLAIKGCR